MRAIDVDFTFVLFRTFADRNKFVSARDLVVPFVRLVEVIVTDIKTLTHR